MALEQPILAAVIAHLPHPKEHLAAFGITFLPGISFAQFVTINIYTKPFTISILPIYRVAINACQPLQRDAALFIM